MLNKWTAPLILAAIWLTQPQASFAQSDIEGRVGKLEKEVRAVQRKVFPQGSDRFFEPEITPENAQAAQAKTNQENAAVRDLLGRVNALEEQLATLTGQLEEQQFKMRAVETKLAELDAAVKSAPVAAPVTAPTNAAPTAVQSTAAPATAPSSSRRNAVAAIEIPDTGNAFEDSYNYGFRLWNEKFNAEAQVQLQDTIDKFPNHPRASFARNLLGRAWLDDGKPTTAAKIFYDNYNCLLYTSPSPRDRG